jgi:hypothetical protein
MEQNIMGEQAGTHQEPDQRFMSNPEPTRGFIRGGIGPILALGSVLALTAVDTSARTDEPLEPVAQGAALVVDLTSVNTQDPTYPQAFAKFQSDPLRSSPWGGDSTGYPLDMYTACPDQTQNQNPRISYKYNPKGHLLYVGFDSGGYTPYCDLAGTYSERASLRLKKPGSRQTFKGIGETVLHTDGLREELAWNYGMPQKYTRENIVETGINIPCSPKHSNGTRLMISVLERFTGNPSQTFQHVPGFPDASQSMPSTSATYVSVSKVCH